MNPARMKTYTKKFNAMKTQKIRLIMLAMLIMLTASNISVAQEVSKTISKEFKVNRDATLSIENRFGKIHCNVWDKNEVTIEVVVTAKARNQRDAERMIENVSIDISGNANKVEAITSMPGKTSIDNKSSISIDYTINMPRALRLVLNNKFGDIYVDENTGSSLISLDYGNLQIKRLSGKDHQLNMRFSKGTLGKADELRLEMSYSELFSNQINDLVIDSKFSTFEVENSVNISHDSQYDTNRLGDSESVRTVAKFSTITIGSISETLDLDVRYGGCTVKDVGSGFKEIVINNSFGTVDLRFAPEASFKLEAESSFGDVSFPKNSNISVEEVSFTGKSYKGVVGKDSKATRIVNITTRNGNVNLRLK
jgi:hypothetical protein